MKCEQLAFLRTDARAMEEEFIEQQTQHSSMKKTFEYIHPHTPCRNGLTASLHGGHSEDVIEQAKVLYGFRTLEPAEIYGGEQYFNEDWRTMGMPQ